MTLKGSVELQRRLKAIGDLDKVMGTLAEQTRSRAKRTVARKTGNTGRTIRVGSVRADRADVIAGGASVHLEFGTKPHLIRARRARALRFAANSGGQRLSGSPRRGASVVFARSVKHPGTSKQPFLLPAAEYILKKNGLQTEIVKKWNGAA